MGAVDLPKLRAALWTLRALRRVRRQLRRVGLESVSPPRVPPIAREAETGVRAVLRRREHTCLERALILQHWRAAHGDVRDVVVGVAGKGRTFRAHAWLEDDEVTPDFRELRRVRL